MNTGTEYTYIRAWGRMMGSFNAYIEDQVALARRTQAPQNATHYIGPDHPRNNGWSTTDECLNDQTRRALGLPELTADQIAQVQALWAEDHARNNQKRITALLAAGWTPERIAEADACARTGTPVPLVHAEQKV